ncbi:hypothetical protein ZHAS_00005899 [Anopheles sinensis]|uniref:Uncharacterized protein n=1 Tax=Anopheles sinensis TaxID=74873 RepID=A0A084VKJ9_ANOSI|nr:hypothetical protein ZHAS_00005899 [Anopheles sinensis]
MPQLFLRLSHGWATDYRRTFYTRTKEGVETFTMRIATRMEPWNGSVEQKKNTGENAEYTKPEPNRRWRSRDDLDKANLWDSGCTKGRNPLPHGTSPGATGCSGSDDYSQILFHTQLTLPTARTMAFVRSAGWKGVLSATRSPLEIGRSVCPDPGLLLRPQDLMKS